MFTFVRVYRYLRRSGYCRAYAYRRALRTSSKA